MRRSPCSYPDPANRHDGYTIGQTGKGSNLVVLDRPFIQVGRFLQPLLVLQNGEEINALISFSKCIHRHNAWESEASRRSYESLTRTIGVTNSTRNSGILRREEGKWSRRLISNPLIMRSVVILVNYQMSKKYSTALQNICCTHLIRHNHQSPIPQAAHVRISLVVLQTHNLFTSWISSFFTTAPCFASRTLRCFPRRKNTPKLSRPTSPSPATAGALAESPSVRISVQRDALLAPSLLASASLAMPSGLDGG